MMDDETFVLLSNQFKRERDQLKEAQQKIQANFETAQRFQDGFARFKKGGEGYTDIKFLMWDIVRQFTDWIAVYPADRSVPTKPAENRNPLSLHQGNWGKSYKPLIVRECSYSICPT